MQIIRLLTPYLVTARGGAGANKAELSVGDPKGSQERDMASGSAFQRGKGQDVGMPAERSEHSSHVDKYSVLLKQ